MAAFGAQFADEMACAWFRGGEWGPARFGPLKPLPLHPGSHVLHYASNCFEGMKAFRWPDGSVRIFRLEKHVDRMLRSAELLCFQPPPRDLLLEMIVGLVARVRDDAPEPPGSLYLRPTLIGTEANVGAATVPSAEACLFVVASPVGDYFRGGLRPLKIFIDEESWRTAPHFGAAKTGGNYASALPITMRAKAELGVDQVLFCPGGVVEETGAANFLVIRDGAVVTKALAPSFLAGVTRSSVLALAPQLGLAVEEIDFSVGDLLEWIEHGEAALTGTAVVVAGIGSILCRGEEHRVGDGGFGHQAKRLRDGLAAVQFGLAEDRYRWLSEVG